MSDLLYLIYARDYRYDEPPQQVGFTLEELIELRELARRKIAKNKKLARKAEKESCRRDQYE